MDEILKGQFQLWLDQNGLENDAVCQAGLALDQRLGSLPDFWISSRSSTNINTSPPSTRSARGSHGPSRSPDRQRSFWHKVRGQYRTWFQAMPPRGVSAY